MEEIIDGIKRFSEKYGVGNLEKVILSKSEYDIYAMVLSQMYPHVVFQGDDLDGRLFIHKDAN